MLWKVVFKPKYNTTAGDASCSSGDASANHGDGDHASIRSDNTNSNRGSIDVEILLADK